MSCIKSSLCSKKKTCESKCCSNSKCAQCLSFNKCLSEQKRLIEFVKNFIENSSVDDTNKQILVGDIEKLVES